MSSKPRCGFSERTGDCVLLLPKGCETILNLAQGVRAEADLAVVLILGDSAPACSRIPKAFGSQSRSGAGAPPCLCFSRNHYTRPWDRQGRALPAEALKAFTACPHTPLQSSGARFVYEDVSRWPTLQLASTSSTPQPSQHLSTTLPRPNNAKCDSP